MEVGRVERLRRGTVGRGSVGERGGRDERVFCFRPAVSAPSQNIFSSPTRMALFSSVAGSVFPWACTLCATLLHNVCVCVNLCVPLLTRDFKCLY